MMEDMQASKIFRKEFISIDGHKHGMIIEGENLNNPVLLFLHGGPGYPQYPMIKASGLEWSKYVTVCYWDQRGTGMSFDAKTQGPLTIDRFIDDTLKITEFLKKEFGKDKIYLFGHSWGTLLGSVAASKHPEHYYAYIGSGQMGRHFNSNEETYQFLLHTSIARNDKKAERKIRKINFDENFYQDKNYRDVLNRYLIKYGGGMKRENYKQKHGLMEILKCREYTWKEKLNFPRGLFTTYQAFGETIAKTDLVELANSFEIPVYIMQGKYDYQTTYNEAKRFFELIRAPHKKMYTFESSAHTPFLEEQDKFTKLFLQEVLTQHGNETTS
ncbi:alpha/beta fold hydrolase [Gracilibacillus oryzae]|uniref:Alpha/beta fold hydrolase n=1 Tax=Gracilibacillus oryzae TaxID=1672701 RepID=A0A7C8GX31_9BACI|nr:alpha/beta fold hydrolase [Gracilibacillus oryzae]KAB8139344.1 alpha/beta fold hydrolase [Gracilibacillus oryzae]